MYLFAREYTMKKIGLDIFHLLHRILSGVQVHSLYFIGLDIFHPLHRILSGEQVHSLYFIGLVLVRQRVYDEEDGIYLNL
jgi:hypothetical protein